MSDFRDRQVAARDARSYPGLYAAPSDVQMAQAAAARWAHGQDDPARAVEDERELRYRALMRSTVYYVLFGIPLALTALSYIASCVARAVTDPSFTP